MSMSTALLCIAVGLIILGISIYLSERSRKKFNEVHELLPEPEPVLADLSGVPTVRLVLSRQRLIEALDIPFEAQTHAGLCEMVGAYAVTSSCIKVWDENLGNNHYPVEYEQDELLGASYYKFSHDYYKMRNPKRRRLAQFMIKCINLELAKRHNETR